MRMHQAYRGAVVGLAMRTGSERWKQVREVQNIFAFRSLSAPLRRAPLEQQERENRRPVLLLENEMAKDKRTIVSTFQDRITAALRLSASADAGIHLLFIE